MPDVVTAFRTYRFDQMAVQVKDKVHPDDTDVDRYVGLEHIEPESLKIRRWGEPSDVESTKILFRSGDIIFGKRRAYQRKLAVADFDGICSAHAMVLRPKTDVVLKEFLPVFMQMDTFMERAVKISVGGLSPTINWTDLAKEEFALPPIEEQRRIANALTRADEAINALRQLVESLLLLRRSLVDEIAKHGSSMIRLGDHCAMMNGRPFPGNEYCDDGVLLLRPGNLGVDGYIDWSEHKTKRVPNHYLSEADAFVLRRGDVVINLTAQSLEDGFMGRVCLVTGDQPSLLNQRIGRFHKFSDALRPEFLFRCLQGSRFQAHAVSMCEGSKIKHLFWSHLALFSLPALDPERQEEACSRIRELDHQIAQVEERMNTARDVRSCVQAQVADGVDEDEQ